MSDDMREAFERSMKDQFPGITMGDRHGSAYWTPMIDNMWQGFQLAWQSQQAQGEPFAYCFTDVNGDAIELCGPPTKDDNPCDTRIITALYRHPPAPSAVPEGAIQFVYLHPRSGEKRAVTITRKHIIDNAPDLLDDLLADQICHCEPIGETNVVECGCDDYIEDFELQEAASAPAGPESTPEYSQGVCQDGAAILRDGEMMTIEEILAELRGASR